MSTSQNGDSFMAAMRSAPVRSRGALERKASRITSSAFVKGPLRKRCSIKASTSGLVIWIVVNSGSFLLPE